MKHSSVQQQRGMTLLIGLIMLLLLIMSGLAAFQLGRNNSVATANVQYRMETTAAAAAAVEDAISSANFIANPSAAMSGAGCATNTNNKNCYDVTGDGTPDIIVQLTPAPCIKKVQAVKNSAITDPSDGCIAGAKQNMGLEGSANDNSLCSETLWEITAVATDAVTSANSTVTSGVTVRIAADDAMSPGNICPP
jgi:Tfp pilus assembly protein PilX